MLKSSYRQWLLTILAFLVLSNTAHACSCLPTTVSEALAQSDAVFRGTIIAIRDAKRDVITDILQPRMRIVVFQVSRVWKGDIGQTFEMPLIENRGGLCVGFWPGEAVIGNEFLVYASRSQSTGEYSTNICSHTRLAKRSTDFEELGPGKEPSATIRLASSEEINLGTDATANDVHRWLDSGDPRLVAWGAYFAGKHPDDVSRSMMLQLVDRWTPPQNDGARERWKTIAAMSAVLDTLIQGNEKVPAAGLSVIASSFPGAAVILASRYPVPEISPLLLAWYDKRKAQDYDRLPRLAALMLAETPPPGFAASVLAESEEQITVSVRSDEGKDHGGVAVLACGDGVGAVPWQGWPPLFSYYLEEETYSKSGGTVVIDAGSSRITFRHWPFYEGWGSCNYVRPFYGETRHQLLAQMLGLTSKDMPWQAQRIITVHWKDSNQFVRDLRSQIASEEAKLHATVQALYAKKFLTRSEANSVRPKLLITVSDRRESARPPLPKLVFRDPRTVLSFKTNTP